MTALAWLIPAALFLGLLGVVAFMWALRSGQFEDLDGAAYRILDDEPPGTSSTPEKTPTDDRSGTDPDADQRRDHSD